jgi:hypothetical protein
MQRGKVAFAYKIAGFWLQAHIGACEKPKSEQARLPTFIA